jgi:integrase
MGTVYKETFTKPLPAGAKIIVRKGQRLAEWIDTKGKRRTAPVTIGKGGADRIVLTARTFTAKYRDGENHVVETATGCRDESAARSLLTELEKRADKVRSGIRTTAEDRMIDHQETPLADHLTAYFDHQTAKGITNRQIAEVRTRIDRMARECGFDRLAALSATALEKWLTSRQAEGMGPRTRNAYRAAAVAFCNWCVQTSRLIVNPLARIAKADEHVDRRRQRRALTEGELRRLLDVARRRPLLDRLTVYKGARKGQRYAKPRPEVRRRLERLGLERALMYKMLVLTGLRRGELASITVGQVALDADPPHLVLNPGDEKNRQGSTLPLRADLAADL